MNAWVNRIRGLSPLSRLDHGSRVEGPSAPAERIIGVLSMISAATRAHVAPDTVKAWHAAGLVSAVEVGKPGKAWRFDGATFDREVAALPRCAYSRGCNRPVAEVGTACHAHRLAVEIEGKPRAAEIVEKSAAGNRKYQDGDYFCQSCGGLLKERSGWAIARRKANAGAILCGSCAAKRRHQEHPYSKGRWRYCPTCGEGPDWVMPFQEEVAHCSRCFRSAPDVRAKKSESRRRYLETPEGRAAHELALQSAQAVHAASTAALRAEGLVPMREAAEKTFRAMTTLRSGKFTLEHREFGGLVRLGIPAPELGDAVYRESGNKGIYGKLNKPLSALNGTDMGRTPLDTLRPGTAARIIELHESGSYVVRGIAEELGVSKSHVHRVIAAHKASQLAPVPKP